MSGIVTDQLRIMAAAHPDEAGYVDLAAGAHLTFAEWHRRSNRLAHWFVARGVAKGDRIAIHLPPEEVLDWLVAYSAVHNAGGVPGPPHTPPVAPAPGAVRRHARARGTVRRCST